MAKERPTNDLNDVIIKNVVMVDADGKIKTHNLVQKR